MQDYALQAKGLAKTYKAVGPTAAKQALKGIDLYLVFQLNKNIFLQPL